MSLMNHLPDVPDDLKNHLYLTDSPENLRPDEPDEPDEPETVTLYLKCLMNHSEYRSVTLSA
jgi:hypothetical protein